MLRFVFVALAIIALTFAALPSQAQQTSNLLYLPYVAKEPVDPEFLVIQPDAMPRGYSILWESRIDNRKDGRVSGYYRQYQYSRAHSAAVYVIHEVSLYRSLGSADRAFTAYVDSYKASDYEEMAIGGVYTERQLALHKEEGSGASYIVLMRQGNYLIIVETLAYLGVDDHVTALRSFVTKAIERYYQFYPIQ